MKSEVPIFGYHDLSDGEKNLNPFHAPYVPLKTKFCEQMQWLSMNGYRTLTLDDLINHNVPQKSVVLTFDDGHISNYELAFPILKKFNFVATFFIVPKYIGSKNYITREQILEMTKQGMRFESHSLTHTHILSLSKGEIDREVHQSKEEIQSLLNSEVNHFSVPYGFYNRYLVRCVEKAGYKSLVTENFGYYVANKNPFPILPRFTVKSRMDTGKFKEIAERRKGQLLTYYSKALCLQNVKRVLGYRMYIRLKSLILNSPPSDIYK